MENRELTMDDYLAMARRRMKMILIPALLAPLAGFAVSYLFSSKYTSQSLVLVEGQKVPEGIVQPVVTTDLTERIATLQQQVLTQSRLRPMLERAGLVKPGQNADDAIEAIRNNMAMIPTLKMFTTTVTTDSHYMDPICDEVRQFHQLGGQLIFGTDVGYMTDYSTDGEFVELGKSGLDWKDILAMLTVNPAARMGVSRAKGTVTPIKTATNTARKPIKVGAVPLAITAAPNGKTVFVLDTADNVTAISTTSHRPRRSTLSNRTGRSSRHFPPCAPAARSDRASAR